MKTVGQIILREWKRIFRLPVFFIVLLIVPPILFLFYGFIYQNKFAENLPVAIWDEDHSEVSATLTDMMHNTKSVDFTEIVHSKSEMEQLILENKVQGAVHIPKDLEKDIKNGKQTQITVYTNASSLVASKMIYKDAAGVVIKGGLAVVFQKLTQQGMPASEANALIQPIRLNTYTLYNPEYNYQEYLVPGLVSVGLQMVIIIVCVFLLNWEIKTNTVKELIEVSNGSAFKIIAGKALAVLGISWVIFIFIQYFLFPVYDLNRPDTSRSFFVLFNLLVLACIGFGMLISAIFDDVMISGDIALFFTSPAFVFSGFTFPRNAMPWYDQYYAELMPYTHFLDGFIKAYFMQLPFDYYTKEMLILCVMIFIFFGGSILVYRQKINRKFKAYVQGGF